MADLSSKQSNETVMLVGSDELYFAAVDSVGRLATNANVTFPEVFYESNLALNGSNDNMNVNGATVNQNFTWTPSTYTYYLEEVSIVLADNTDYFLDGFGGLSSLTNGLSLEVKSKGVVQTISTFKTNYSIETFFNNNALIEQKNSGLLGTVRQFKGSFEFKNRIALDSNLGDFIRFIVKDNLTGLTNLHARFKSWRING